MTSLLLTIKTWKLVLIQNITRNNFFQSLYQEPVPEKSRDPGEDRDSMPRDSWDRDKGLRDRPLPYLYLTQVLSKWASKMKFFGVKEF